MLRQNETIKIGSKNMNQSFQEPILSSSKFLICLSRRGLFKKVVFVVSVSKIVVGKIHRNSKQFSKIRFWFG